MSAKTPAGYEYEASVPACHSMRAPEFWQGVKAVYINGVRQPFEPVAAKPSYEDLQARIKELEAQLEAIGAGGVSGQRITKKGEEK